MGLTERFVFALGVTVANVPEGLLPTVTLSLALATQRMARRNAIVRRLSSVETLGATDVICTDKTGTLTANQMTVRRVWLRGGAELEVTGAGYSPQGELRSRGGQVDRALLEELARCGALCNDATLEPREGAWTVVGDPTEGALLTLAHKVGLDPEREAHRFPRRGELPFDSARKRMTTVHDAPGGRTAYVKGAPSSLVPRTTLDEHGRAEALAAADAMARDSLRVLALARRAAPPGPITKESENELELLGLVGMHDPPRPEVADAIKSCRTAGIRVIMVTGDNGITAEAIARRIGLLAGPASILDGPALDALDDDALVEALTRPGVLVSRVTPEQKLRIAAALRGAGSVVAMTGDGVNDAPALRTADIGVAMGRSGTDVAREAADIVLLDDNFASIAAVVEEGRAVYDNIRRFAQYHFSSNVAELMAFLVWGLSGGAIPLPLVVMQVLAVDLGTDLLPAIALGTERAEPGVMKAATAAPHGATPECPGDGARVRVRRAAGGGGRARELLPRLSARRLEPGRAARRQRRPLRPGDGHDLRRHRRRPGGLGFRVSDESGVRLLGWAALEPFPAGRHRVRDRPARRAGARPCAPGGVPHEAARPASVAAAARMASVRPRRRGAAQGAVPAPAARATFADPPAGGEVTRCGS
jgi:P-type Ca2+ transporter type 2C